jgi:Peptidase family M28
MKKNDYSLLSMLIIVLVASGIFYFMMPQNTKKSYVSLKEFSTSRALNQVESIAKAPHFVGSKNHQVVVHHIDSELRKMGLEPSVQEGYVMTEGGTLVKAKNIVTRIKGSQNSKALLLLSHYDSAPHSFSNGASDNGAGVATILESVRAFLYANAKHKNDIIVLFTDAEELSLNGATLFVTQHAWAKEVGLALNFDARGTSGPSYMLMETNGGNAQMVTHFSKANIPFPVCNSLMYSIYKMLPNDTDLTVFREKGNIQGFNFAFIDSHYNYHTMQDVYKNLDPKTLAHQGSYLMALLNYFSNTNLKNLNTPDDKVYFSIPFTFVSYPFSWILPMLIGTTALFLLLVLVGLGKQLLRLDLIIKGFFTLFGTLILVGGTTYYGWKGILMVYPQYNDILQGFTYNGHDYILAFMCFSLAICFRMYQSKLSRNPEMNQFIAALFVWIVVNFFVAIYLKGAAFFIIPVLSGCLILGYFVSTQKTSWALQLIFSLPALALIFPFCILFPVGLGLKILYASSVLLVLVFALLLPIFGAFENKKRWSNLFFLVTLAFLIKAHLNANYEPNKAKPNSLLYVLDAVKNKAYWTTYDTNLDSWTKAYLGETPRKANLLTDNKMYSKYGSSFTYMAAAPVKDIQKASIQFLKDSTFGASRFLKIVISPNRNVNRYDLFVNNKVTISNLIANGVKGVSFDSKMINKKTNKFLTYYVVDNEPLTMEFSIKSSQKLDMSLLESSFDLLSNAQFTIPKRSPDKMATPFVLNDAIVVYQEIIPTPLSIPPKETINKIQKNKLL